MQRHQQILAFGAATAVSVSAGIRWLQSEVRKGVYPAPHPPAEIIPRAGIRLLRTSGVNPVPVLYSPPPFAGAPTVVLFHGNGGEIAGSADLIESLGAAGFGAAAVEYVGYGPRPTARPSEARITASCVDALDLLRKFSEVTTIVLAGHSMGSVFAMALAARGYGDRLVLAAPVSSGYRIARGMAPWVPPQLFLGREKFDNLGLASQVSIPALVIHGDADDQLPVGMGRELAAALPRGHFTAIPGAGHQIEDRLVDAVRVAVTDPRDWPNTLP